MPAPTPPQDFSILFAGRKKLAAAKGQLLVRPDDTPGGVFFLHDGYVKAFDIGTDGSNQIITITGPHDILPLYWALGGERPRLFFETMCPVRFSMLPREAFAAELQQDTALLQVAIARLLHAARSAQQRIQNLELRSVQQKLAFRLLFLGNHFGNRHDDAMEIAMPLTHQDLADSLNLTRDTVNRAMREFISEGIVDKSNHHVSIRSISALQTLVGATTTLNF